MMLILAVTVLVSSAHRRVHNLEIIDSNYHEIRSTPIMASYKHFISIIPERKSVFYQFEWDLEPCIAVPSKIMFAILFSKVGQRDEMERS